MRTIPLILLFMVGFPLHTNTSNQLFAQPHERCFIETGFCISGRIREFWEKQGGLTIFGYPKTAQREEIIEGKRYQVQWFERYRFEWNQEQSPPHDIFLGRLGAEQAPTALASLPHPPSPQPPSEGCLHFDTGWNVCDDFLTMFRSKGIEQNGQLSLQVEENVALFGLPLSPVISYTIGSTVRAVQFFERARFEFHPEELPPYRVQLGLLGNEALQETEHRLVSTREPPLCNDVPDSVNANVHPSKCVKVGDIVLVDIFGFLSREYVGFWITAPNDTIIGTKKTMNIGKFGEVKNIPINTQDLSPGLWSLVFQGTTSGHKAIVYFKIGE